MTIYTVSGMKVDFVTKHYQLLETCVYGQLEDAMMEMVERVDDFLADYDEAPPVKEEYLTDGIQCDYTVSDHEGGLLELKLRKFEI